MTENSSSGETSTVKRRDVLRATGAAAAGGALMVGATGSASAHCIGQCIEFTTSDQNPPSDIDSVTINGNFAEVCASTNCTIVVYVKAGTDVTKLTFTREEMTNSEGVAGANRVCKSATMSQAISNVTVCPTNDRPGYCDNANSPVNCDGESSASGGGNGNNGNGH